MVAGIVLRGKEMLMALDDEVAGNLNVVLRSCVGDDVPFH
jgi:hypothetical protein